MKVLVSGGAGYIGSHAVVQLLDKGYEVVVIDNLSKGHKSAVDKRAVLYEADLRNEERLNEIFKKEKIDVVMQFAADIVVPESVSDPLKYYDNNFYGTLCLLRTMIKNNVKKIVFSSTAATYGEPESNPIQEADKQKPINAYGSSKLFVEKMLKDCQIAYGLNYVIFRYFNVAGSHEKYNIGQDVENFTHLIPVILEVAMGKREKISVFGTDYDTKDGSCVRDYIHVVDLVDAHILAIDKLNKEQSNIYNLGNGCGFTVLEMIQASREVTGHKIPSVISERRAGDPAKLIASSEKAKKELGWNPKYTDIKDIIKTAWRWHSKNPEGYNDN